MRLSPPVKYVGDDRLCLRVDTGTHLGVRYRSSTCLSYLARHDRQAQFVAVNRRSLYFGEVVGRGRYCTDVDDCTAVVGAGVKAHVAVFGFDSRSFKLPVSDVNEFVSHLVRAETSGYRHGYSGYCNGAEKTTSGYHSYGTF